MSLRSRGLFLPERHRLVWAIGIYAVLGLLWIVASDALVLAISSDPAWIEKAQHYKGMLYVLLTAGGLLLLVHSSHLQMLRTVEKSRHDIEQQESLFQQLHRSLGEVLWLASPDHAELLYVSPAFETLYGRPRGDLLQQPNAWIDDVHPDDRAVALASHQQVLSQGESECVYRIVRPDGSQRWVSDRKKLIVDGQGRVQMIGGIVEDITAAQERAAAQALTRSELERMVCERTAELERVNRELEAFTRTAAHDLKTPLHTVAGFSHLLQVEHGAALGDEGRVMLGHIERAAHQMSGLVNDLMSLSRVNSEALNVTEVDLAALAREQIAEFRRREPARQVQFEAPESLRVHIDAGLARSLLANLLGNAWKFSSGRQVARIALSGDPVPSGPVSEITVSDNGAGFEAPRAGLAFQPFQRFHSQSEFAGTGIGLVTCQRIVHRHGGTLMVDSLPGAGATVRFTLPAAAHTSRAAPVPRVLPALAAPDESERA